MCVCVCVYVCVSVCLCLSSLVCMIKVIFVYIDTVFGIYVFAFFVCMLSCMFQLDYLDTCCFECLKCTCFIFLYLPLFSAVEHVLHVGKVF